MNIPPLFVRIVGDDASAVAALRRVSQSAAQTRGVLSGLGSASRTLARDIAALAGAGGLTAVVVSSVRAAVEMDSLRQGLRAVSIDAGQAEQHMRQLQELAKLPGLGFQEAIRAAQSMRALGRDVESTNRILREFSNAVALGGGGRAQLALTILQLNQMASAGKVLMTDLRPLIQQAPVIGRAVQQAFGTIQPEQINELGISFEEFLDRVLTELEGMARAPRTALTAFENLGDSLFRLRAAAAGTAMPEINAAVNAMSEAADFAVEHMQSLVSAIVTVGEIAAISLGVHAVAALKQKVVASRAAALAELAHAKAALDSAAAAARQAVSARISAVAVQQSARALEQVVVAAQAYNAALIRTSITARVATAAVAGLRGVLSFFGGPIGLAITAISAAFILLQRRAASAAESAAEAAERHQRMIAEISETVSKLSDEEKWRALEATRASNERAKAQRQEIEQLLQQARLEEQAARRRMGRPRLAREGPLFTPEQLAAGREAAAAQKRVQELTNSLQQLNQEIERNEAFMARLSESLAIAGRTPPEAELTKLEQRANTLISILESQRALGESTTAVMAQLRQVHAQTLALLERQGDKLDAVTAGALELRQKLAEALTQPAIDAARERIRLTADAVEAARRRLQELVEAQLPLARTIRGFTREEAVRGLAESAEREIGRLPRFSLPQIRPPEPPPGEFSLAEVERAQQIVQRALDFGIRPEAMPPAMRAEFEAAVQTLREYRKAQEEVTRALDGMRISAEQALGVAGSVAQAAAGLVTGRSSAFGAFGSIAGSLASLFASGSVPALALEAASIVGGVLDTLFGGDDREREEQMFRAHLRALRQAAEEQIIDVTIVLPDTLDPQNPIVQERLGETIERLAANRRTRVKFQSRAAVGS